MTNTSLPGNRGFVLASEIVFRHYRQQMAEIDREWSRALLSREGIGSGIDRVKTAARAALRSEVRELAKAFPPNDAGTYLIPV